MAIARTIPDAHHIDVDLRTVRFSLNGERHVYLTPYSVSGYVVAYDAGDTIHPFSFQLREDQRVAAKSQKRTEAGLQKKYAQQKLKKAKDAVTSAERKLEQKKKELPKPEAKDLKLINQELGTAKAKALSAQEEQEAVRAAYEGQASVKPRIDPTEPWVPRPLPRVIKTSKRTYGMRVLRVNGGTEPGV